MPKAIALGYERVIAGLGVVACCGLLILAVPRFIASLYGLYPEAAFSQTQENLPQEVHEKSIADLKQALAWYEDPDYWQLQAFFYLSFLSATPTQPLAKKQALLEQAQASIIQGLKLSPVDPYAWFRLATVDKILKAPTQQIVNALRLSFYAGRVEPELLMPRLSFSYDYYIEFDEEMRGLWQKQLPVAWKFKPVALVEFVALHPEAKRFVEEAFVYSPDEWKKFSRNLEVYLKKHPLFQAK